MLDRTKYDISVFAITDYGPNKEFLKDYCTLLNISGNSIINKKRVIDFVPTVIKRIKKALSYIGVDISPIVFKRVASTLERNNYDLVISFQEGGATLLASYFQRTKKIAWIRCDYQRYLVSKKIISRNKRIYGRFNRIICVSEFTRSQLLKTLPELSTKTISLHNLINDDLIISKSKENISIYNDYNGFKVVSVGRFDVVKRFELIPQIASFIKSKGFSFKWIILGDGKQELIRLTKEEIERYGLEQVVILLGDCKNPYPYIVQSDLLVCLSSTEACPNVINEAKILHTPVVSTDFGSSREFLENNYNGLISSIDNIGNSILSLIENKDLYYRIKRNISHFKYSNQDILRILQEEILN